MVSRLSLCLVKKSRSSQKNTKEWNVSDIVSTKGKKKKVVLCVHPLGQWFFKTFSIINQTKLLLPQINQSASVSHLGPNERVSELEH